MNKIFKIGNISFSNILNEEILELIRISILERKSLILLYAEMHQIVLANRLKDFNKYFSISNYVFCYGNGLYQASKFLFGKTNFKKNQIGTGLQVEIFEKAKINNWKIFLLGSDDYHLQKLRNKYSNIIIGAHNGYFDFTNDLTNEINNTKADILMVGMGSPLQEKWIYDNYTKLNIPIIMSIGNGINVLSGNYYRPPKIIFDLGFEWLIRLLMEPKRLWKRYIFGIPYFIFIVFKQKFFENDK